MSKGITKLADVPSGAPVGKDPLAVEDGVNTTSAQMEYLRAVRERPTDFHTNSVARLKGVS